VSGDAASAPSAADQPGQNGASNSEKARADFAQQAHDEADAAQEALDSATEALDQLESDAHHGNRLMPPIRRSQQREPTKMPPTRQRKRRMKPQGQ
jgi:hypothetical protein